MLNMSTPDVHAVNGDRHFRIAIPALCYTCFEPSTYLRAPSHRS